ncbi:MAG: transposase [Defluviitaleaceae bacterium]|nr:transposase [Defluviitaleaceae bacterium]
MPRKPRQQSETGIYHIMTRGIDNKTIFRDSEDFRKFLFVINDCKEHHNFKIYAYCLMDNHLHLLVRAYDCEWGAVFKRVGAKYVHWYNRKYNKKGPLFWGRFKSVAINTSEQFLTVLRYIHQNPIKAGICDDINHYVWSSYGEYATKLPRLPGTVPKCMGQSPIPTICDVSPVFKIIDPADFIDFHNFKPWEGTGDCPMGLGTVPGNIEEAKDS